MDSSTSPSRWPGVLGTAGVILGGLIVLDQVDDLLVFFWWDQSDWSRLLAPDVAALVERVSGPVGWRLFSGLAQVALGTMLVAASIRLRGRRASGVRLSLLWAWLAIAFAVVEIGAATVLLWSASRDAGFASAAGFEAFAALGLALALALIVAWPILLLAWLTRPAVKAEAATWSD